MEVLILPASTRRASPLTSSGMNVRDIAVEGHESMTLFFFEIRCAPVRSMYSSTTLLLYFSKKGGRSRYVAPATDAKPKTAVAPLLASLISPSKSQSKTAAMDARCRSAVARWRERAETVERRTVTWEACLEARDARMALTEQMLLSRLR